MTDSIDAITTRALSLALDAAALRQQAIASNIANHATPGYSPVKVDFAAQMQEARTSFETKGSIDAAALRSVQPRLEPSLDANGRAGAVQLDVEMADMAQNAVHYQALVKALSRHMSILSLAASDGKR